MTVSPLQGFVLFLLFFKKKIKVPTFSLVIVFDQICLHEQVYGEELADLLKLHDSVYEQANSWFTSLKDNMKSQILSHFGHLPSKDPDPQVSSSTNVLLLLYCQSLQE